MADDRQPHCAAGTCEPHAADTDPDGDCQSGESCDGAGSCKGALSEPCTAGAECVSGQCVDGVCCDSVCAGPCAQCNAPSTAGTCTPLVDGAPSEGASCDPYYCDGINLTCPSQCAANDDCMPGTCCGPNNICGNGYPNGLGGYYSGAGSTEAQNALLACESHWGVNQCCNDGCGSCNAKGYHNCRTPNCNGSVYWNYANNLQDMGCSWNDPNEILISLDGKTWIQ